MSLMFLNDVRERPVSRRMTGSLSIGLYAMAALAFVIAIPLCVSYLMGGLAPMLLLTVYLLPLVPLLMLVVGVATTASFVAPVYKTSGARHA